MTQVFRPDLFANRNVYIAGGTSGINLGIGKRLSDLGANLVLVGRNAERAANAVEAVGKPGSCIGLSADVRDYNTVEQTMRSAVEQFGLIDIVVSGAAGNFVATANAMSANGFRTVVDIDLNGTFNVFRASFAYLRKPGASLIAITSSHAVRPMVEQAHVCAAKAGINQLIRVLAMEWGRSGVRVNGISPGPIEGTEGMRRLAPTFEAATLVTSRLALGRYGKDREIGDAVAFLSSPAAEYITGTILDVDGGTQLGDSRSRTAVFASPSIGG